MGMNKCETLHYLDAPIRHASARDVACEPASLKPTDASKPPAVRCSGHIDDRVALGRCRPEAPTDPYLLALEHTVPQIMVSLLYGKPNEQCARGQVENAGAVSCTWSS